MIGSPLFGAQSHFPKKKKVFTLLRDPMNKHEQSSQQSPDVTYDVIFYEK